MSGDLFVGVGWLKDKVCFGAGLNPGETVEKFCARLTDSVEYAISASPLTRDVFLEAVRNDPKYAQCTSPQKGQRVLALGIEGRGELILKDEDGNGKWDILVARECFAGKKGKERCATEISVGRLDHTVSPVRSAVETGIEKALKGFLASAEIAVPVFR